MSDRLDPLLSRPVRLHWAGWETDTYRLQKAGWDLSAAQGVREGSMRLAMRHEGVRVRGISETQGWDYMREQYGRDAMPSIRADLASDFFVTILEPLSAFMPIDAQPQPRPFGVATHFEDFAHFAPALSRSREIILPEETVPELLERILMLQQPARTERIRREVRDERERFPIHKIHAQIISLAA